MTLHFSQIGFTEDLTFTAITSFHKVHLLVYHKFEIFASTFFEKKTALPFIHVMNKTKAATQRLTASINVLFFYTKNAVRFYKCSEWTAEMLQQKQPSHLNG